MKKVINPDISMGKADWDGGRQNRKDWECNREEMLGGEAGDI